MDLYLHHNQLLVGKILRYPFSNVGPIAIATLCTILEVTVLTLLAILSAHLIAVPAAAQTGPQSMTMAAFMDCMKDAVSGGDVDQGDGILAFSCSAARAKVLYNFLGRKIKAEIVVDRNGKFENRRFAGSACYHRIEDASGKAVDDFRCDLVLAVDDALQD